MRRKLRYVCIGSRLPKTHPGSCIYAVSRNGPCRHSTAHVLKRRSQVPANLVCDRPPTRIKWSTRRVVDKCDCYPINISKKLCDLIRIGVVELL